jgi:hypothetical protein
MTQTVINHTIRRHERILKMLRKVERNNKRINYAEREMERTKTKGDILFQDIDWRFKCYQRIRLKERMRALLIDELMMERI